MKAGKLHRFEPFLPVKDVLQYIIICILLNSEVWRVLAILIILSGLPSLMV